MTDQPDTPGRVQMAYAWPKRPSEWRSIGAHHVVVTEPLHVGRLHRAPGDALCKQRGRFWGLDTHEGEARRANGQRFDCTRCLAVSRRLGLNLSATERPDEAGS